MSRKLASFGGSVDNLALGSELFPQASGQQGEMSELRISPAPESSSICSEAGSCCEGEARGAKGKLVGDYVLCTRISAGRSPLSRHPGKV